MRLVQFAKWCWDKGDGFSRTIVCSILFCVIPSLIASIWVGKMAILLISVWFGVILAGWLLYGIFYFLRNIWNNFNDENPTEDVAIMRKLKGIPTPSRKEVYHDYD